MYDKVWTAWTSTSWRVLRLPMGRTFHWEEDQTSPRSPRALWTLVMEVQSFQKSMKCEKVWQIWKGIDKYEKARNSWRKLAKARAGALPASLDAYSEDPRNRPLWANEFLDASFCGVYDFDDLDEVSEFRSVFEIISSLSRGFLGSRFRWCPWALGALQMPLSRRHDCEWWHLDPFKRIRPL